MIYKYVLLVAVQHGMASAWRATAWPVTVRYDSKWLGVAWRGTWCGYWHTRGGGRVSRRKEPCVARRVELHCAALVLALGLCHRTARSGAVQHVAVRRCAMRCGAASNCNKHIITMGYLRSADLP